MSVNKILLNNPWLGDIVILENNNPIMCMVVGRMGLVSKRHQNWCYWSFNSKLATTKVSHMPHARKKKGFDFSQSNFQGCNVRLGYWIKNRESAMKIQT